MYNSENKIIFLSSLISYFWSRKGVKSYPIQSNLIQKALYVFDVVRFHCTNGSTCFGYLNTLSEVKHEIDELYINVKLISNRLRGKKYEI